LHESGDAASFSLSLSSATSAGPFADRRQTPQKRRKKRFWARKRVPSDIIGTPQTKDDFPPDFPQPTREGKRKKETRKRKRKGLVWPWPDNKTVALSLSSPAFSEIAVSPLIVLPKGDILVSAVLWEIAARESVSSYSLLVLFAWYSTRNIYR
jgi:hypothetical protein